MSAALAPLLPFLAGLDLTSAESARAQDPERLQELEDAFVQWAVEPDEAWLAPAGPGQGRV
jgi:hypothetical protein